MDKCMHLIEPFLEYQDIINCHLVGLKDVLLYRQEYYEGWDLTKRSHNNLKRKFTCLKKYMPEVAHIVIRINWNTAVNNKLMRQLCWLCKQVSVSLHVFQNNAFYERVMIFQPDCKIASISCSYLTFMRHNFASRYRIGELTFCEEPRQLRCAPHLHRRINHFIYQSSVYVDKDMKDELIQCNKLTYVIEDKAERHIMKMADEICHLKMSSLLPYIGLDKLECFVINIGHLNRLQGEFGIFAKGVSPNLTLHFVGNAVCNYASYLLTKVFLDGWPLRHVKFTARTKEEMACSLLIYNALCEFKKQIFLDIDDLSFLELDRKELVKYINEYNVIMTL